MGKLAYPTVFLPLHDDNRGRDWAAGADRPAGVRLCICAVAGWPPKVGLVGLAGLAADDQTVACAASSESRPRQLGRRPRLDHFVVIPKGHVSSYLRPSISGAGACAAPFLLSPLVGRDKI